MRPANIVRRPGHPLDRVLEHQEEQLQLAVLVLQPLHTQLLHLLYERRKEGRKEMFYLTTHSKQFIYGYMASDI